MSASSPNWLSHGDPASSESTGVEPARTQFVINLMSSMVPPSLEVPFSLQLPGVGVFRSHVREDGRDRYRLHLGYFESREEAEALLPSVREYFAAAWITAAPQRSLGSLDDTHATDFRAGRELLLSLFEEERPLEVVRPARVEQRYVVQLVWSADSLDADDVLALDIFRAYTLYTVTVTRAQRRWFGVRLGFFRDVISAQQVALYVRDEFPDATVLPVSDREFACALEATRSRQEQTEAGAVSEEESGFELEPHSVAIDVEAHQEPESDIPAPVVAEDPPAPRPERSSPPVDEAPRRMTNAESYRWETALSREQILDVLKTHRPESPRGPVDPGSDFVPYRTLPFPRDASRLSRLFRLIARR
jgi:hypothetical protein